MAEGITRYAAKAAEDLLAELGLDPEQMAQGGVDVDEWNGAVMVAIDAAQLEGMRRLARCLDAQGLSFATFGPCRAAYRAALTEALRQLGRTEKDLEG